MVAFLVLIVCGIFLAFGTSSLALCPQDPTIAIQRCMADVEMSSGAASVPGALIGDIAKAKQMCKSNKILGTIECMDKIKNECVDSEYERYLNSMINIKGWRDASTILCDNLEYMIKNNDCLTKGAPEVKICMETASQKGQANVQAKLAEMKGNGEQPDQEQMLKFTCSIISDVVDCMMESPMKRCPDKLMHIVEEVFYGLTPPICQNSMPERRYAAYGGQPGTGIRAVGSATLAFVTVLLSYLLR